MCFSTVSFLNTIASYSQKRFRQRPQKQRKWQQLEPNSTGNTLSQLSVLRMTSASTKIIKTTFKHKQLKLDEFNVGRRKCRTGKCSQQQGTISIHQNTIFEIFISVHLVLRAIRAASTFSLNFHHELLEKLSVKFAF